MFIYFHCGQGLQEDFNWLVGIKKDEMKNKENNCELFFELEDFDEFIYRLKSRNDIIFAS